MADTKDDKRPKNSLGISKGVYAAGNAVKDGFIATGIISTSVFTILQFGGKHVKPLGDFLKKVHEQSYGLKYVYEKAFNKPFDKNSGVGAAIGLSLVAGTILGHFFQIKGAKEGHDIAEDAIAKHDAALAKINTLENKLAQYEGSPQQAATEQKSTAFTDKYPPRSQTGDYRTSVTDSRNIAKDTVPSP